MMKTALRRGGRLIAVTALATAFLGSTAGAEEPVTVTPTDSGATATATADATATSTQQATVPTEREAACKMVTLGRSASFNYFLSSKATGGQNATAAVDGDASLEVCYDLDVTAGASVTIDVAGDATATASADASTPDPTVGDAELACVSAVVVLLGDADAKATGTVKARVSASAAAGAMGTSLDRASAGSANADADGDGWLTVNVARTVGDDNPTADELVATGACMRSDGEVVDP